MPKGYVSFNGSLSLYVSLLIFLDKSNNLLLILPYQRLHYRKFLYTETIKLYDSSSPVAKEFNYQATHGVSVHLSSAFRNL